MRRLLTICVVIGLIAAIAGSAAANQILKPTWIGEDNTLQAKWESWEQFPGPMLPDMWASYPDIGLTPPEATAYEGADLRSFFDKRADVIELTGDSQLDFYLPNFPSSPEADK